MDNRGEKTDQPVRRSLAPSRAGTEPPDVEQFLEDLLRKEIAYEIENSPGLSGPALDHIAALTGLNPELLPSFGKLTGTERAAAVAEAAQMLLRLYEGMIRDRVLREDRPPSSGPASPRK